MLSRKSNPFAARPTNECLIPRSISVTVCTRFVVFFFFSSVRVRFYRAADTKFRLRFPLPVVARTISSGSASGGSRRCSPRERRSFFLSSVFSAVSFGFLTARRFSFLPVSGLWYFCRYHDDALSFRTEFAGVVSLLGGWVRSRPRFPLK